MSTEVDPVRAMSFTSAPWTRTAVQRCQPRGRSEGWASTRFSRGSSSSPARFLFLALAPSAYYAYLAIHILSAVIWVGGDVTLTVLGIVFERRGEGATLGALGRMGAWIGTRVYTPTLVVTLVFGIILMQKGNFDWGQFWVIFALVGWTIAALVGVGFVGPELGRIDEAARMHGPGLARGRDAREAAVHDLPLRHRAPPADRGEHGREAELLTPVPNVLPPHSPPTRDGGRYPDIELTGDPQASTVGDRGRPSTRRVVSQDALVPPEGLGASRLTGEERRDSKVESGAMVSEDLAPRKHLTRESPS